MLVGKVIQLPGLALAAWVLCAASAALACNIPVFRYALERWPADPYHVVVFHRGQLAETDSQVLGDLRRASVANGGNANLTVHTVDLDEKMAPATQELWQANKSSVLPLMVVTYPRSVAAATAVWSAPLSQSAADEILDSPVRREIVQQLLDGQSAVWLLVESGDPARDEAMAKLLAEELAEMPNRIVLPFRRPLADSVLAEAASRGPDLKIAYSVLRLSRNDPAERFLRAMLLKSAGDLETEYAGEPVAFPVFGRGRMLDAVVGRGINARNILALCRFLAGPCSCQVKDENPGLDLLISAAWDESLGGPLVEEIELPSAIAPSEPGHTSGVAETLVRTTPGGRPGHLLRNILIVIGFMVLVIVVLVPRVNRRMGRS